MLLCTTAWAAEVADTLTATGIGNSGQSAYAGWTNKQFGSSAVYAGNTSGGNGASNACIQMRVKNNNSGIVTTTSGGYTVKKVTVSFNTQTSSGTLQVFGKSTAYESAADLYGDNKGTLVGEITFGTNTDLTFSSSDIYPYIGLRSKSGTIYIDQIEIVWDTEAPAATVAAPVIEFSPATAYEGDEVTCSISCATDGAAIQYSTDGETYQEYNGEFTLNATTTVYAKATLNNEVSEIAQKTITFGKAVQNIAEFNDLENNEAFKFNGTVTVLGQKDNNLYVQDANKGMHIYGTTSQKYTFGDIIPAGFKGTKTTFKDAPEMTNPADFAAATENVKPTAIEMTIANVTLDNFGRYGVIRGATINGDSIVVGNAKVAYFNRFDGVDIPTDNATYDVYGVASYHNGYQFLPLSFNKVETPVEFAIEVSPEAGEYTEPVTVTITANADEAMITYTLNGGDELDYTEPFTLNETTAVHVYATDGTNEDTWDGTYTINIPEPVELDGMIVFADNEAGDASAVLDSDGIIGQATDTEATNNGGKGGNYIESASDIEKVYAGAEGLKFSSSSTNGKMTLNLKDKWNATKISFIARNWNNAETGKYDAAKMTVNGNEFDLTNDFALYEFVPENQVEAITFAATNRAYLKVINIEGETVTPQPSYDIVVTPTPEEGKVYKSGITVKAEVTPELPEGASLKYVFVETGATEEAVENDYTDAGVKLSKSGTLTFIARDAANAELARKSVDYTFSLVGDLNGDGIVDVSDVQYLVNIILGKVNFDE